MKKLNNKGVSAIIITVLLVFVAVILGGILLSWGRGYTDKGVNQAQTVTETKYNASDFVYPEKIDAGVVKFRYSPPADLKSQNIEITKYKIISENKESEEKTFNTPLILEEGVNTFDLENFFDLGVANSKVTVVLITSDNKYINLENISNTNAKRLKVETPTADPALGLFNSSISVSLSCATKGATIYYTTNGSTPTTASSEFKGGGKAIQITQTTTLKAIAVKEGYEDSDIFVGNYIKNEVSADPIDPIGREEDIGGGSVRPPTPRP